MIKVLHRINSTENLIQINSQYGIEVDVHGYKDDIVVNHDPLIESIKFSIILSFQMG